MRVPRGRSNVPQSLRSGVQAIENPTGFPCNFLISFLLAVGYAKSSNMLLWSRFVQWVGPCSPITLNGLCQCCLKDYLRPPRDHISLP
jgi:hypothetical protein